jgi:YVTN family beta-propeller protein
LLVAVLLFALAPTADAATLTNAWQAKIGTAGANGVATINAYTTGAGSIVLKLARLRASTTYTVVLAKGTCSKVGPVVVKLASVKTRSTGAAARTTNLTASQVNAIRSATRGSGKIAIRLTSGSSVRCGQFAALGIPPYVAAKVTVGRSPSGVAVDPAGVWVTNWWDNTLSRINPATNTVLAVLPIDFTATQGPEAIGIGAGSLWVTATEADESGNSVPGVVKRIDSITGATLATIPIGRSAFDIDVSAGAVWVANHDSGSVMRIDPATNQVTATIPIPVASGVTVGLGAVWVVGSDGTVTRIDPATNQIVTTIATQTTGAYVATGNGAVWVTHPGDAGQANGSLSRIDPATHQVVANVPLGSNPQELAVSGANVWVGMLGEPTVVRVSATANAVLNRVAVSSPVYALTAGTDVVWAVHNLPSSGDSGPPAGAVSRISASPPLSAAKPTPPPAPTPSPSPTATPTPSPSGGTLILGPSYVFGLPAGWSSAGSNDPAVQVFDGPGNQAMAVSWAPTSLTLEEVRAQVASAIKARGGGDPESVEATIIGGSPAWLMTFHFQNSGIAVHQLDAVIVRNGRAYEISYGNTSGTEAADRAAFSEILGTFGFLNAGF